MTAKSFKWARPLCYGACCHLRWLCGCLGGIATRNHRRGFSPGLKTTSSPDTIAVSTSDRIPRPAVVMARRPATARAIAQRLEQQSSKWKAVGSNPSGRALCQAEARCCASAILLPTGFAICLPRVVQWATMAELRYLEFRPGRWVKLVDGQVAGPTTPEEVAAWKRELAEQIRIWEDVVPHGSWAQRTDATVPALCSVLLP